MVASLEQAALVDRDSPDLESGSRWARCDGLAWARWKLAIGDAIASNHVLYIPR